MLFLLFIAIIIVQRAAELMVAKSNEKWMKSQGALEFGQGHYKWIVFIHTMFLISCILEVFILEKSLSPFWPFFLCLFVVAQAERIWAISSLGRFWNTKIIVLPGANVIRKGPYRFFKHPNYMIVAAEFLVIPLLFKAHLTAIVFTIVNSIILSIRIPAEEKALKELTEYEKAFLQIRPGIDEDIKKV
ncbi:isoprenylcysteine carboxyl methyltransferase family protein [Cytobacillus sp. NCCP-133]|uniref:isoprenylcysteine carboxyl methyltransferase family protein n=1 Tax=Cytobacillus sp. NCCP-133 TaxID=766848 RepID=UPI00222EE88C|nr:isoprenylcysteine carboxylmethyltransferase family protein [Cytobacillus sp. NCCP-133]GLB57922.1 hypothetical protein NCCP133_00550 [Cytobacillus sp. NCCP-133]